MNRERLEARLEQVAKARLKSGRIRPDTDIASDRDGDNFIERRGSEIFFKKADEGQWYHIYDVRIERGVRKRVPYESSKATHRIFVMPQGEWWYELAKGEVMYITASSLTRQRVASKWHASKGQHSATSHE